MDPISFEENNSCKPVLINMSYSTVGDLFNEATSKYLTLTYFIGSCFSILSILVIMLSILVNKSLRKHPAHLVLCRVVSDLIVSLSQVVFFCTHAVSDTLYDTSLTDIQYDCRPYSAAIEFGLLSGYAWNFIFAVDLLLAVRRPFQLHGSYLKYYHAAVWIPSLIITVIFVVITLPEWQPYGMSMFFHCWVNVADLDTYTLTSLLVYFLPTSVMFCVGVGIAIRVLYILKKVSVFSPDFQSNIAKLSFGMLFGIGIEWIVASLLWITNLCITYSLQHRKLIGSSCDGPLETAQLALTYIYAIIHSNRGCIVLVAWAYSVLNNRRNLRKNKLDLEKMNRANTRCKYRTIDSKRSRTSTSSTQERLSINSDENIRLVNKSEPKSESDTLVEYMFNSELRRYTVVCINYAILDSAKTAQSQIAGDSQHHLRKSQLIQKSMSMRRKKDRNETRTIQIPANFIYHKFDFINYSPLMFKNLRDMRGIDEGEFMKSFPQKNNETAAMVEKFTEGKSGSFFFFSHDRKYIVKTISMVEVEFLMDNLQEYCNYLKNNPNSLLTRYYGLVKLRFTSEQEFISVVIMENVFYLHEGMVLQERYDLKGSVTNRQTVKKGMERPRSKTMKDLDMDGTFRFKESTMKNRLVQQLESDTRFLQTHGSMDYSLLVGVAIEREDERVGYSGSMHNNYCSDVDTISVEANGSFQWVDYHRQNLHWYMNGKKREHTPSDCSTFASPITNPGQSLFSQFRKGFFKLPAEKILKRRPRSPEVNHGDTCFLYVGIIDMLQPYNMQKKMENLFKTKIRCLREENISAVQPYLYRARFLQFVRESVFSP